MIDKKAYQKMDYALCLLSAHADGKDSGCIINSFHQVTSSFPAKFTIAVNRENVTAAAVEQAGSFCVTLLAHDAPAALINDFGYRSGRVADKFSPYEVRRDEAGNPYLTDSMVSRVSCRVIDRLEIGSYTIYVGQATEAEVFGSGEVLEFELTGDKPQAIHMLPGYTHNIINLSETENLVTLMCANEQFDPAHPDTFFEKV